MKTIYPTDQCPRMSARALDDRRVLVCARGVSLMLSEAVRRRAPAAALAGRHMLEPRPLPDCPEQDWAASSWEAFRWTLDYGLELCSEYAARDLGRGVHAASTALHFILGSLHSVQPGFHRRGADFTGASRPWIMPEGAHPSVPVHQAWQLALSAEWRQEHRSARPTAEGPVRWTRADPPAWFAEARAPAPEPRHFQATRDWGDEG